MLLRRASYLLEADDDDNAGGGGETDSGTINGDDTSGEEDYQAPEDDNDSGNNDDNQENEENQEENQEEENTDDETIDGDNNEEENDYDAPEDGEEEGDNNSEENTDDQQDDGADTDTEDKQVDRDMFETLSEEEKKQKISTLKHLYLELYNKCDHIIERYNSIIDQFENFAQVGKRVIMTLIDLKNYIADYVLKIYDSKSYIENDINYNRCLSVLNGIKMVTQDLAKIVEEERK